MTEAKHTALPWRVESVRLFPLSPHQHEREMVEYRVVDADGYCMAVCEFKKAAYLIANSVNTVSRAISDLEAKERGD